MTEMGDSGDGVYIGGPEVEAEIAKIKESQAGNGATNSGGSDEAEATSRGKAGGESKASGDGNAGPDRGVPGEGEPANAWDPAVIGGPELEAKIAEITAAESTAEAVSGSAAGADRGVPGEGESADARDSSDTGGPEVESTLAQQFAEKATAYARENPDVIIKTINVLSWACTVYPTVAGIIGQGTDIEIPTEGVQECLESAKMFLENLPGIQVRQEFQQNKDDMFR
jgi:hypothetical protein